MAYNASDKDQVRKARKKADITEAMIMTEVRNVMSTSPGRRWLYRYLESAHVFGTSIVFGSPDHSAFNEGERNIGNMILADIQKAAPEMYLRMIKEAKSV